MNSQFSKDIHIYGSKKDIAKATAILEQLKLTGVEPKDRLVIQDAIDEHRLQADILYKHNGVWSRRKILKNLRRIIKAGVLVDTSKPNYIPLGSLLRLPAVRHTLLSKYFYEFLHLCCGSIAHYSIYGWVSQYPTVDDLKAFFDKNEFGVPVRDHIPGWKTDVIRLVADIEHLLFPFRTFMNQKEQSSLG